MDALVDLLIKYFPILCYAGPAAFGDILAGQELSQRTAVTMWLVELLRQEAISDDSEGKGKTVWVPRTKVAERCQRWLRLSQAEVTRQVKQLRNKGFLRQRPGRRESERHYTITEKGEAFLKAARQRMYDYLSTVLGSLSEPEIQHLLPIIKKVSGQVAV